METLATSSSHGVAMHEDSEQPTRADCRSLSTCIPECEYRKGAARAGFARDLRQLSRRDLVDNRNRFVPRGSLISAMTDERVLELLRILISLDYGARGVEQAEGVLRNIAGYVCGSPESGCACGDALCTGRRILFATFILMEKEPLIKTLSEVPEPAICDSTPPFREIVSSLRRGEAMLPFSELLSADGELELFCHLQWQMRSPYFHKLTLSQTEHIELDDEVTLPWTLVEDREEERMDGEYSFVQKIKIQPDHHELAAPKSGNEEFALKVFVDRETASWTQEEFLREVNANQLTGVHDRIVPLLAAFKYRNKFYMIFPWATGGSLQDLWEKYTPIEEEQSTSAPADWYSTQWLLKQSLGIADGLAAIHGFPRQDGGHQSLRTTAHVHADIKPQNILCFASNSGENWPFTLKLADFGLSRQHGSESKLNASQFGHLRSYRPPEQDIEDEVSLEFDIWCLGCLYLDFATWAVLGGQGVEKFSKERADEQNQAEVSEAKGRVTEDTFFKLVSGYLPWHRFWGLGIGRSSKVGITSKKTATKQYFAWCGRTIRICSTVKDRVRSHLDDLRNNERCDVKMVKLLNFVESRMLVVDPEKRGNAIEVREFLEQLEKED